MGSVKHSVEPVPFSSRPLSWCIVPDPLLLVSFSVVWSVVWVLVFSGGLGVFLPTLKNVLDRCRKRGLKCTKQEGKRG